RIDFSSVRGQFGLGEQMPDAGNIEAAASQISCPSLAAPSDEYSNAGWGMPPTRLCCKRSLMLKLPLSYADIAVFAPFAPKQLTGAVDLGIPGPPTRMLSGVIYPNEVPPVHPRPQYELAFK